MESLENLFVFHAESKFVILVLCLEPIKAMMLGSKERLEMKYSLEQKF
jgi:hypothetical protein